MALYEIKINGRQMDLSALNGIIVSGDNNADTVRFVMNRHYGDVDMSAFAWMVVGRNSFGNVVMTPVSKLIPIEGDTVKFDWKVTDEFTDVQGMLDLWFSTMSDVFTWSTVPTAVRVEQGIRIAEYTDIGEQYLEQFSKLAADTERYKNSAALSAQEAKSYAVEISASIQAAAQSASEALKSMQAAKLSENAAQLGKTAAEAANTAAQAAKADAIAAKNAAVSIRDSTEVIVDVRPDMVGFRRADETDFRYTANLKGNAGDAATISIGNVETVEPDIAASVTNSGTLGAAVLEFAIPRGQTGKTGSKGDIGATPNLTIGAVSTLDAGSPATATISGTTENPQLSLSIPRGYTGTRGERGIQGEQGMSGTMQMGQVYTLAPNQGATATNIGTAQNAIINLGIPKGDKGDQGEKGDGLNIAGTFTSLAALNKAYPAGNGSNSYYIGQDLYVWDGSAWNNRGTLKGDIGADGKSAYRLAQDSGFTGTQDQWLASLKGDKGGQGEKGDAATVEIGSVTTGSAGSNAEVVNVGTIHDAVFDIKIPRGDTGKTAYEAAREGGYTESELKFSVDLAAVSNKADKDQTAVEGNLSAFDAQGNPIDSGKKVVDFATANHLHELSYAPLAHTQDETAHIKKEERIAWNGKADKTYVDIQLSNKAARDLGVVNTSDLFTWASEQVTSGSFLVFPTITMNNVPTLNHLHGFLEVRSNTRRMICTEEQGYTRGKTYVAQTYNGKFIDWNDPFATATPSQELDLPLSSGLTPFWIAKYTISQDSKVNVIGTLRGQNPIVADTIIFTMPIGTRPSGVLDVPLMFFPSQSTGYGTIDGYGRCTLRDGIAAGDFAVIFNLSWTAYK